MSGFAYRPEYVAALTCIARAFGRLRSSGRPLPILVGGAVVEFDTGGRITSGDFDFVGGDDEAFAAALVAEGFVQGDGKSMRRLAFVHTGLGFGAELVSGRYFDGLGEVARARTVAVPGGEIRMASTEDMIADRLGQWEASGRRDQELVLQALTMFRLADAPDLDYLERRIRQDTAGAMGVEPLEAMGHHQISLTERAEQIQARLDSGIWLPDDTALMNSGRRRTEAKRQLLRRLRKEAEATGFPPPFKANF